MPTFPPSFRFGFNACLSVVVPHTCLTPLGTPISNKAYAGGEITEIKNTGLQLFEFYPRADFKRTDIPSITTASPAITMSVGVFRTANTGVNPNWEVITIQSYDPSTGLGTATFAHLHPAGEPISVGGMYQTDDAGKDALDLFADFGFNLIRLSSFDQLANFEDLPDTSNANFYISGITNISSTDIFYPIADMQAIYDKCDRLGIQIIHLLEGSLQSGQLTPSKNLIPNGYINPVTKYNAIVQLFGTPGLHPGVTNMHNLPGQLTRNHLPIILDVGNEKYLGTYTSLSSPQLEGIAQGVQFDAEQLAYLQDLYNRIKGLGAYTQNDPQLANLIVTAGGWHLALGDSAGNVLYKQDGHGNNLSPLTERNSHFNVDFAQVYPQMAPFCDIFSCHVYDAQAMAPVGTASYLPYDVYIKYAFDQLVLGGLTPAKPVQFNECGTINGIAPDNSDRFIPPGYPRNSLDSQASNGQLLVNAMFAGIARTDINLTGATPWIIANRGTRVMVDNYQPLSNSYRRYFPVISVYKAATGAP